MTVSVSFGGPLTAARFVRRTNRFVVQARLVRGELVDAHLADPGRLKDVLIPQRILGLRPASGAHRKTSWRVVLARQPTGRGWLSLDSTLPNRLIGKALAGRGLPELPGWSLLRSEYPLEAHRFDFLLRGPAGGRLLLEVKSVGLVEEGLAWFPDAVTDRGRRHVEHLTRVVEEESHEAAVLFVVQRGDAAGVRAAAGIDPAFATALAAAERVGVRILGRRCLVREDRVSLGARIPASA